MKSQVLVSGCSYTYNYQGTGGHWPDNLFAPNNVVNLSRSGAGNLYISMSIMDWIKQNKKPDFVFILWSGYRRIDVCIPSDSSINGINNYGTLENSRLLFSGGQWNSWVNNPMSEYFLNQYNTNNQKYLLDQSSIAIMNCHNFLKSQNIKYKFAFIYDIFKDHCENEPSLGALVKKSQSYLKFLDWNNFIDFPPFEYGIKYNLLQEDGFHLTDYGMNEWASKIKHYFTEELV
jgi:hypothetical protein